MNVTREQVGMASPHCLPSLNRHQYRAGPADDLNIISFIGDLYLGIPNFERKVVPGDDCAYRRPDTVLKSRSFQGSATSFESCEHYFGNGMPCPFF